MDSFGRSLLSLAYRPNEKHFTYPEFRDLNCQATKIRGSSGKDVDTFLNDLNEAIINIRTKEDADLTL